MKKVYKNKEIVCFGGGTGTFVVLSGLKKYPVKLSAIVTMTDEGGSTGILRDELGILPPGDVRQCLVALSREDLLLRKILSYRFTRGTLRGHNFGNIFMAALEKVTGSFDKAVERASKILNISGEVIPITLDKARLCAKLKNNVILKGETKIDKSKLLSKYKFKLFLEPKAKANPKAILAIKKADLIVIGPGNLYCTILPNLLVEGICGAIRRSKAKVIYNCNLMTKQGHTDGFRVEDFVRTIENYIGKGRIDYVTFNTQKPLSEFLKKYAEEGEKLVNFDSNTLEKKNYVGANLINPKVYKRNPSDIFYKRSLIRHRPDKLAKTIIGLLK